MQDNDALDAVAQFASLLETQMHALIREQNFEGAAEIREQLTSLTDMYSTASALVDIGYDVDAAVDDDGVIHLHARPNIDREDLNGVEDVLENTSEEDGYSNAAEVASKVLRQLGY